MKIIDEREERQPKMFGDLEPGEGFEIQGRLGLKFKEPVKVIGADGVEGEANAMGLHTCEPVWVAPGQMVVPVGIVVRVER
jgi:hypothetical protein